MFPFARIMIDMSRFRRHTASISAGFLLGLFASHASAIPAFPGAEGYGANALGGRGGDVYYVTTLKDDGPGSLRFGIASATNPRTILFKVSGNIQLLSNLSLSKPRITIAGQTAPGDGICVQDYPMLLNANDLIVRHIRSRLGTNKLQEADSMTVQGGMNIIVDHCSASWSVDETLSVVGNARNVTLQWTYITESLNNSIHAKGQHGYASLFRPNVDCHLSVHHSFYAHHSSRNPRPGTYNRKVLHLDFRNNVIYNWANRAGYSGDATEFVRMNYVGNYLLAGPSTTHLSSVFDGGSFDTWIYQSDNRLDVNRNGRADGTNSGWGMFIGSYTMTNAVFDAPTVQMDTPEVGLQRVLAQAGALPWRRDAADARVAGSVRNQNGRIIDHPGQGGGFPTLSSTAPAADTDNDGIADYWEQAKGFNPLIADNNSDLDGDGYTNLEDYLNWLAGPHAVGNRNARLDVNLRILNGASSNLLFTVANGTNGAVSMLADGYTARFLPATNFNGRASFTFKASDSGTGVGFGPMAVELVITDGTTAPNSPP